MADKRPYKIIGAYDSETTNIIQDGQKIAFPILHQLGILKCDIQKVTPDNVEDVTFVNMVRHASELYEILDDLIDPFSDYVPVIMCHNLAFDMYGLAPWLNRHNVRVLAKSERKPITFNILDDNENPVLVIWDTLIFSGQSLERMGNDCGYSKAIGEWDYNLVRTPSTPLTEQELDYAAKDIYTLLAWFSWWVNRNPDIDVEKLGKHVVTKTGIVRERRRVRFNDLKGINLKSKAGRFFAQTCAAEAAKTDDELFTNFAATRGGLTFCSSVNASKPFDLVGSDFIVAGYDATSQHPAQLVSHVYPVNFKERAPYVLDACFECISKCTLERVLERWHKPFPVAFNACFEFTNLRPKAGSVFEEIGVLPLASARYKTVEQIRFDEDNGDKCNFIENLHHRDYCDSAQNAKSAFGKLISADVARLYLTELSAWEVVQTYDFDSSKAIHGYSTGRFQRPTDLDVLSVMQFYKAKNAFKEARGTYFKEKTIHNGDDLLALGIAPVIVERMKGGTLSDGDVESTYLSLKADLNSIFGIACSNEYRRDTVLSPEGIKYTGNFGVCNAPKNSKVWYQFGQRIVGWSRIAQIVTMILGMRHSETVINGDTDSVKFLISKDKLANLSNELHILDKAIDKGKSKVCERVARNYPDFFDPLEGIGHYDHEFSAERFCASWNKAYCMQETDNRDGKRHFDFTLAGIPTKKRSSNNLTFLGVNGLADRLYTLGMSFEEVCNVFLGYNVTFANDVLKLNGRTFPDWGDSVFTKVEDYQGNVSLVAEPKALALFPMSKTINDTNSNDNAINMLYAQRNNPHVNTSRKLVTFGGINEIDMTEILKGVQNA